MSAPPERYEAMLQAKASGNASLNQAFGDMAIYHQTVLPGEALRPVADVAAPDGLMRIPDRTQVFVGRSREMARLDTALSPGGGPAVFVIHGLGGIGKSALATHWAYLHRAEHQVTWWLPADTEGSIDRGLADLAVALQPELAEVPIDILTSRALLWLSCHDRWLLILDDVQDENHLRTLLARAGGGRFVITSRLAERWRQATTRCQLGVLSDSEAGQLLALIATDDRREPDLDGAADLVHELGGLPLAVEQAAAHIRQMPAMTPRDYLDLLARYPADVHDNQPTGAGQAISRVWRMTLDRLAEIAPLAGTLLKIMAWYAPEPIPREVMTRQARTHEVQQALASLAAYNMISLDAESISVHRLVQAVARVLDPDDPHRKPPEIFAARLHAVSLLAASVPEDPDQPACWPAWRALLPHVLAITEHTLPDMWPVVGRPPRWLRRHWHKDAVTAIYLLRQTADFLDQQGSVERAIFCNSRAHKIAVTTLGADSVIALTTQRDLAVEYVTAGKTQQAVLLAEKMVAGFERAVRRDDPMLLAARRTLANAYLGEGDLRRAIPLYEHVVADLERALSKEDDPGLLQARGDLARGYFMAGEPRRAIPLYEKNLAEQTRIAGSANHPDALETRLAIGAAHEEAGDLERARSLLEPALRDHVQVLGSDHPRTLQCRAALAETHRQAGDLTQAIPLFEQAMDDSARTLGSDHLQTITARQNLALAYRMAGDYKRAISLYKSALNDLERVTDPDNPYTLMCRINLATAYEWAGRIKTAIRTFEQALADHLRVLGTDHPSTLTCQNNLAHAYQSAHDMKHATPLFAQALENCRRVHGEDHPSTQMALNNLAFAYQLAGDLARAIPLFEQALSGREETLTGDHLGLLAARINLARAYHEAGNEEQAIPLLEQAVAQQRRIHGDDHPRSLEARVELAMCYVLAGRIGDAVRTAKLLLADQVRVLGADHPDTLHPRIILAMAYLHADAPGPAIPLLEKAADQIQRRSGDHSDELLTKITRAAADYSSGDTGRASALLKTIMVEMSTSVRSARDTPDPWQLLSTACLADRQCRHKRGQVMADNDRERLLVFAARMSDDQRCCWSACRPAG